MDGEPVQSFREQRYSETGGWLIRDERYDVSQLLDLGTVHFHSKLHHDIDRAFGPPVERSIIVVTVCGEKVAPRTFAIPYYPLPSQVLKKYMSDAGFDVDIIPAAPPDRKYDVVVGKKVKDSPSRRAR